MRIGFVELLLILLIASLTIGPSAALWVDRWLRRANRASAAAARRRAVQEAQRAAEREEVLQRFQKLSIVFTLAAVAALVWVLVLRPIEAPPKTYTAPDHRQASGAAQAALSTDRREIWDLGGYQGVDCIRTRDGLVYAAAWNGSSLKKRTSDLVRTDGGNAAVILSVEGELTGFAFDAAGDLWLTVLTPAGGTLCRARHDSWGASVEQVVTQIDGAPLGALSAVEVGADGKVYFAVVGQESAEQGLESALRTELLAHTGTGAVYVYDPAARTVEQVVGGIAGASGLALDERTQTLYISDLGSRCIWSAAASARGLTAGGKGCQSSFSGLPGYPGALALDEDSTLYISYRWASSSWLERHAGSTFLRGVALRLSESVLPARRRHPRRGRFHRQRKLAVELFRQASGQQLCPLPGGEPGVFWHHGRKSALFCTGLNRSVTLRVPAPLPGEPWTSRKNCCKRLGPTEYKTSGHRGNRSIRGN